ncbi:MAG TPA: asparagine synthase (glutamine-hydrolyzing) [Pyrinomonadaceae bacterium]|nr:asparagine synthase (glutamine-hydrolyzing) [Pyrinomonadaceae bacterium]
MCGFAGSVDMRRERRADEDVLVKMTDKLVHRGPDSAGYFIEGGLGLGFRRLSIIDLETGDQPLFNEDRSVVVMCNGEIYNYRELRAALVLKGHTFRTEGDVEVLVHLYEEEGVAFINKLNGQFSFVLYDRKEQRLLLARDHFGINPLYYTVVDDVLIFASEIKAILEHPAVERRVDLTGLDQIFSFPGIVSPRTMFQGINSLKGGHYLLAGPRAEVREYWDLDYPRIGEIEYRQTEDYYVDKLRNHFARAVGYRLQADVPVGFYLSGGQDSSMIAAMIRKLSPDVQRHSFSIGFTDREINEREFQRMMAKIADSVHHEIIFDWSEIASRLTDMIYHCECPVKESYNTCSLALSEAARNAGVKVILTGEGADELFAGYVGYRYDQAGNRRPRKHDLETILEEEMRTKLWGDRDLFYEADYYPLREIKTAVYSERANELYPEFDCVNFELVNKERLRGRHLIHQRSYLDTKLRLADHLLSDHGDRMALANSVEARYPFLDIELAEFAKEIPPDLKLHNFTEKYILKKVAADLIPKQIIRREKFGFRAPGSPYLLQQKVEWINDLLSYERIKRQGYFNPDTIEHLKSQYSQEGFKLHPHLETDLLMMVLTFGILTDLFGLPSLS